MENKSWRIFFAILGFLGVVALFQQIMDLTIGPYYAENTIAILVLVFLLLTSIIFFIFSIGWAKINSMGKRTGVTWLILLAMVGFVAFPSVWGPLFVEGNSLYTLGLLVAAFWMPIAVVLFIFLIISLIQGIKANINIKIKSR